MKKLVLTLALVFSLAAGAMADGGGLFSKGNTPSNADGGNRGNIPGLVQRHGLESDANGNGEPLNEDPLTDGVLLLAGLGAAYLIGKRKKD